MLSHYLVEHADVSTRRLAVIGLPGEVVDPARLTTPDLHLLGQGAGLINHILDYRSRLLAPGKRFAFQIVERDDWQAKVLPSDRGGLVLVTSGLIEDLYALMLQLSYVEGFAELFDIGGAVHHFSQAITGGNWVDALLTSPTPEPTVDQYLAGQELAQLALGVLVNHEIGHAINGHRGVFGATFESFDERGAAAIVLATSTDAGVSPDWAVRQVLEIDADSFGIGVTLLDALAGHYPADWEGADGPRPPVTIGDPRRAIRAVGIANRVLWACLDPEGEDTNSAVWTRTHPPVAFRVHVTARVLASNLAAIEALRPRGAPEFSLEDGRRWHAEAMEAFRRLIGQLDADLAERLDRFDKDALDAHEARLRPTWNQVKSQLPPYRMMNRARGAIRDDPRG